MSNWTFNGDDQQAAGELGEFLPPVVWDAHAHVYRRAHLMRSTRGIAVEGPEDVSLEGWRESVGRFAGQQRVAGGLVFPYPLVDVGDIPKANEYVLEQINDRPMMRALLLVSPQSDPAEYEGMLGHPQVAGFKPYFTYSLSAPAAQATPSDYVPQWVLELADERGLAIVLHLVRDKALADPANQQEIKARCREYPNAKLILAHAGRGFCAANTVAGVAAMAGLENLWFDSSAICEPTALSAVLRHFGPGRLLWGSDFPISMLRGRCVTVGNGFAWLDDSSVNWERLSTFCRPILVGLESLRALRQAVTDCEIDAAGVADVFAGNAERLFNLSLEPYQQ